jgi:hypothetical protein
MARSALIAAICCLALPAAVGFAASSKPKRKAKATGGGGFGVSSSKAPRLDPQAKRLLRDVGGDVDAAQEQCFQNALGRLREDAPELFDELMAAEGGLPTGRAHAKLVELFWDAVATYIPARQRATDGGMGAKMRAKVRMSSGSNMSRAIAVILARARPRTAGRCDCSAVDNSGQRGGRRRLRRRRAAAAPDPGGRGAVVLPRRRHFGAHGRTRRRRAPVRHVCVRRLSDSEAHRHLRLRTAQRRVAILRGSGTARGGGGGMGATWWSDRLLARAGRRLRRR